MPGISKERAHQLIRDCIDTDETGNLEILRPMLAHAHVIQALEAHDTWSNTQSKALAQAHTTLIHDYKCAEQQPQLDASAPPAAAAQVPQAPTPLLIPPLNQIALLLAAIFPRGKC